MVANNVNVFNAIDLIHLKMVKMLDLCYIHFTTIKNHSVALYPYYWYPTNSIILKEFRGLKITNVSVI